MDNKKELFKHNLELLLKKKTRTQIASDFGVSRQALYNWIKALDIDLKTTRAKTNPTSDFDRLNKVADKLLSE